MLPKGTIEKINQFYFDEPQRKKAFEKAMAVFFEVEAVSDLAGTEMPEEYLGLANEWFIFDYRHKNGKTSLENYLVEKSNNLTEEERERLKILSQTNHYGLFEVKKVVIGSGLEVCDLQNGQIFEVQERSATYSLKPSYVVPIRLAQVDEHWEMVGSNSVAWPINLQDGVRNFLKKTKDILSPKEIFKILSSDNDTRDRRKISIDNPDELVPEETKKELEKLLSSYQLDQYISIETIAGLCREVFEKKRELQEIISVVISLCDDNLNQDELEKLLKALLNFYNTENKKRLPQNNKKPKRNSEEKTISTDMMEIGGHQFLEAVQEAHRLMEEENYEASVKKFDEVFQIFLEQKIVKPDIYRIFANVAMAYFGAGLEEEGKILLEKSLELNSNYDYAIMTKKRLENDDFIGLIMKGKINQLKERWNFDEICQEWSDDKILKQLAEFGVNTNKQAFLKLTKKYTATEDLAEEEWYPFYTGPDDWTEDFVWMAASILWERWGNNTPALDILEETFNILHDKIYEAKNKERDQDIENHLKILTGVSLNISPKFATEWKESCQYKNDIENFMNFVVEFLFETDDWQPVINLAVNFQKTTGDNFWNLVLILTKIIKKEPDWSNRLENFTTEFSDSILPFILVARISSYHEDNETEEEYLLKGLKATEFAKNCSGETKNLHSPVDAADKYSYVLDALKNFYLDYDDKKKLKEIELKLEETKLNKNKEDKEKLFEAMKNLEQKNRKRAELKMQDSSVIKYFSYLKNLGLNFQTSEMTKSSITTHCQGQKIKIGRNEPCFCGNGKKYKKCHGG